MKKYPINVARLQMVESGQFIRRFTLDFKNSGLDAATDVEFKSQLDDLEMQLPGYLDALLQIRAKVESNILKKLNIVRNQKFSTVRRAIRVYEYADDATEKEAYRRLAIILNTFKHLDKANYETKSLGITLFIKDLRNAKNDALNTLLLVPMVDKLEVANSNFKTTFDTRSTTTISKVKYDSKALRNAIFDTYKDLAGYILLMAKRKNTPFYTTLLSVLNSGRDYYADILARREGVNKKHKMMQKNELERSEEEVQEAVIEEAVLDNEALQS